MVLIPVLCSHCHSDQVIKGGKTKAGKQRYKCQNVNCCRYSFQLHGRYNNAANRCCYACFQTAIAALQHAGIAPSGGRGEWGHAFVQAECVGRLINRRRQCPPSLRQVLARNLTRRHTADYASDLATERQVSRAVPRTRDFLAAVREKVGSHES